MKSNPVCACRSSVSRPIRYASVQNRFWRVRFTIVAFICSLLQYFRAVVFSSYNHLLFLAKTNKENDNNIDFSLSIGQNLKKYSSILD
jgi:hypothetical protein